MNAEALGDYDPDSSQTVVVRGTIHDVIRPRKGRGASRWLRTACHSRSEPRAGRILAD